MARSRAAPSNRQAGARTRWAGAVTGVAVLCFLPFATILAPLPLPVLAATVIVAALGLARLRPLVRLIRLSRWQAVVAWTTFAATLVLAPHVEYAVMIGVAMAILVHLVREMLVDIDVSLDGDTLIFRPRGVLWFASSKVIEDAFAVAIADHPGAPGSISTSRASAVSMSRVRSSCAGCSPTRAPPSSRRA